MVGVLAFLNAGCGMPGAGCFCCAKRFLALLGMTGVRGAGCWVRGDGCWMFLLRKEIPRRLGMTGMLGVGCRVPDVFASQRDSSLRPE